MKSKAAARAFKSGVAATAMSSRAASAPFKTACPPDRRFAVQDLFDFKRGRGDLVFSLLLLAFVLFLLVSFFTQTGWAKRKLPDEMGSYWLAQLGLIEREGRLSRVGRILKQDWVAPLLVLCILVPAALWNTWESVKVHRHRARFQLPVDMRHELTIWARALEFVGWFIVYTFLVPVLGYLLATLLLGTALPWRLGYRGLRWFAISLSASFAIVLVFRTFLQIKTPINIWLYNQLPESLGAFMKTWF